MLGRKGKRREGKGKRKREIMRMIIRLIPSMSHRPPLLDRDRFLYIYPKAKESDRGLYIGSGINEWGRAKNHLLVIRIYSRNRSGPYW